MKKFIIFIILIGFTSVLFAQNSRINEKNNIGWYNFNTTLKLNSKLGIHNEYQWRRTEYIKNWSSVSKFEFVYLPIHRCSSMNL